MGVYDNERAYQHDSPELRQSELHLWTQLRVRERLHLWIDGEQVARPASDRPSIGLWSAVKLAPL